MFIALNFPPQINPDNQNPMQKFTPFFQLVIASWVAKLLGWSGAILATVGVSVTYQQNAPAAIAQVIIGLIGMVAHAVLSHLTLRAAHNSAPTPSLPTGVKQALIAIAFVPLAALALSGCQTVNGVTTLSPTAVSVLSSLQKASSALAASGALPAGKTTDVVNDTSTISNALETINTGTGFTQAQALAVAQSFKSNASTTGYIELAATISQYVAPFVNSLVQQGLSAAEVQAQTTQLLTNLSPAVQSGISSTPSTSLDIHPVARDSAGLLVYSF